MDISHLLYFKEVVEQGSLSKAAKELFISQPALSASISKVEANLGIPLFERSGKKLILNKAGREYYQSVCKSLSELQQGRRTALAVSEGLENLISVGAFTYVTFSTITIPFLNRFPGCQFRLLQLDGDNLGEKMLSGDIDFAYTCTPIETPAINCYHVLTQRLFLTVASDHPLAYKSYIKLTDVRDEPFVLMEKGTPLRGVVDKIFEEAGFKPKVAYETNHASLLAGIINSGEAISIIPDTFSEHKNLTKINISVPQCLHKVYFIWAKDKHFSPAAQHFLDFVMEHYKDYPRELSHL